MEPRKTITTRIGSLQFSQYSNSEIDKISVCEVKHTQILDQLDRPVRHGLYDPRMGPIDDDGYCETCSLSYRHCPGHFGHIDLCVPVYNPVFFPEMYKVLKTSCFFCGKSKMDDAHLALHLGKLCLFKYSKFDSISKFERFYNALLDKSMVKKVKLIPRDIIDSIVLDLCFFVAKTCLVSETAYGILFDKNDLKNTPKNIQILFDLLRDEKVSEPEGFRNYQMNLSRDLLREVGTLARCRNCGFPSVAIKKDKFMRVYRQPLKSNHQTFLAVRREQGDPIPQILSKPTSVYITPQDAQQQVQLLKDKQGAALYGIFPTDAIMDSFFITKLIVPPNRFRPPNYVGGRMSEHQLNIRYQRILNANNEIIRLGQQRALEQPADKETDSSSNAAPKLLDTIQMWSVLQSEVNGLYDSNLGPMNITSNGIKQVIEKKEGLLRRNMMGKRVNFAARSVISPDPLIPTNSIGVPLKFAKVLTFPEHVNERNFEMLREMVVNGTERYPGATHYVDDRGRIISLKHLDRAKRLAIADKLLIGGDKIVYRNLLETDYLLVNRQPTLHKPSLMAHRVRLLRNQNTLRLHYANCKTYNADFDGDEMNLHLPQDIVSKSEAIEIVSAEKQYISQTNGSPLRGLIQDAIIAGIRLTKKDVFLTREELIQSLFEAFPDGSDFDIAARPAILKPVALYTGKQLFSETARLAVKFATGKDMNIRLRGRTNVPASIWGFDMNTKLSNEDSAVIVSGYQILTGAVGKQHFGASKFGLVHSIFELYGPSATDALLSALSRLLAFFLRRRGFTTGIEDLLLGDQTSAKREEMIRDLHKRRIPEKVKSELGMDIERAIKLGRQDKVDSLYKTHLSPYMSELINVCIPKGLLKKFPDNNFAMMTSTGAKGSIVNFSQVSVGLGQQDLEGGRVPLMTGSGKTLPCFKPYDPEPRTGGFVTDRFLSGLRPQEYFFHSMAGREGLVDTAVKTSRSGYLQRCLVKHLEGIYVHHDSTVRNTDGGVVQFIYGDDGIDPGKASYLFSESFDFCRTNYQQIVDKLKPGNAIGKLSASESHRFKSTVKAADPEQVTLDALNPHTNLGAVSERLETEIVDYATERGLDEDERKRFTSLMYLKYFNALVEPGENVGTITAQSIGEPSTQMTLNTFHLAGHGAVNLTLGIPRLREIIMVASHSPSTPMMKVYLRDPSEAQKLAVKIRAMSLNDVIERIEVREGFRVVIGELSKVFRVRLSLRAKLLHLLGIDRDRLMDVISLAYIGRVQRRIAKLIKEKIGDPTSGVSRAVYAEGVADTDRKVEEIDETERRARERKAEVVSYDDKDEEEKKMVKEMEKGESEDEEESEGGKKTRTWKKKKEDKKVGNAMPVQISKELDSSEFEFIIPIYAPKMLIMDILDKESRKISLTRKEGVSKTVIRTEKDGTVSITTEGSDLQVLFDNSDLIDSSRIQTNDVYSMLTHFGVEACRNSIIKEIKNVIDVYGVKIDPRHLSLLADYMTVNGDYRPVNRFGMKASTSPIQKMSYETTFAFLKDSIVFNETEKMVGPSARIAVGSVVSGGTGFMDILQRLT